MEKSSREILKLAKEAIKLARPTCGPWRKYEPDDKLAWLQLVRIYLDHKPRTAKQLWQLDYNYDLLHGRVDEDSSWCAPWEYDNWIGILRALKKVCTTTQTKSSKKSSRQTTPP